MHHHEKSPLGFRPYGVLFFIMWTLDSEHIGVMLIVYL